MWRQPRRISKVDRWVKAGEASVCLAISSRFKRPDISGRPHFAALAEPYMDRLTTRLMNYNIDLRVRLSVAVPR